MGGFLHLVLTIQFLGDPNDLTHIQMDRSNLGFTLG